MTNHHAPVVTDPIACSACGEERLVDRSDPAVWYCQVCGHSGAAPLRLVAPAVSSSAAVSPASSAESLHALLFALVQRYDAQGEWRVIANAPLAQWPRGLQRELTQTLGALPASVVLVLERVPREARGRVPRGLRPAAGGDRMTPRGTRIGARVGARPAGRPALDATGATSTQVTVRLTACEYDALYRWAARARVSVSAAMRRAIRRELRRGDGAREDGQAP